LTTIVQHPPQTLRGAIDLKGSDVDDAALDTENYFLGTSCEIPTEVEGIVLRSTIEVALH
jgi:hypothetical protein